MISSQEREDAERAFIRYYMEKPEADRPERYIFYFLKPTLSLHFFDYNKVATGERKISEKSQNFIKCTENILNLQEKKFMFFLFLRKN